MKIYKNQEGKWCYDFTVKGQRVRKIVGLSKQETESVMWAEYRQIKRQGFGLKEAPKNIDFGEFSREFLELYSKKKKRSWVRDETSINHLTAFFRGKFLSSITPDMIERYMAERREAVSPATVNRELACLKTIFNKAVQWKKIDASPASCVEKFKEKNQRERILTEDEMRRLVEAAADHLKPILIIALSTGMRRNEILNLKWENVNVPDRYIFIEDSKSGKSRKVPMNSQIIAALEGIPRGQEYVFVNPDTKRAYTDIKTGFKAACRRAKKDKDDEKDKGIQGVRLHDLRHTAASVMVRGGVDLVTVSKILGHASIQMTMRYAHPTSENMNRAVDLIGRILEDKPREAGKNPGNAYAPQHVSYSQYAN